MYSTVVYGETIMKNLFRKVRVIHKPKDCSYEIYYKSGFLFPWKYQCHWRYVLDWKPSSLGEYNQEQARELAIKRAKEMAEHTIEWES